MHVIVGDTNVLVSAFISRASPREVFQKVL